jgi:hypothetical protein
MPEVDDGEVEVLGQLLVVLTVVDPLALVVLIARSNDLSVRIEQVTRAGAAHAELSR